MTGSGVVAGALREWPAKRKGRPKGGQRYLSVFE